MSPKSRACLVVGKRLITEAVNRLRFVLDQPAVYDRDIEGISSTEAPTDHDAALAEQVAIRHAERILDKLRGGIPGFRILVGCRGRRLACVAFCHVLAD